MIFYIAETIRRLSSPQHEVSCSWFLWRKLLRMLRKRGRQGSRESGAFLIGRRRDNGYTRIVDFILYDDLDPRCLDSRIVHFDGRHFGVLWEICRRRGLAVVADVHTHPGGADQSDSDRAHPMISRAGHLALILPSFARRPVRRNEIGIYRYLGGHRWETVPSEDHRAFFHIGL
jgi:proteasome lid subunit RPN8/RPN11